MSKEQKLTLLFLSAAILLDFGSLTKIKRIFGLAFTSDPQYGEQTTKKTLTVKQPINGILPQTHPTVTENPL